MLWNSNRRQFMQWMSAGAIATTAAQTTQAGDPFAPAQPGLAAKWFNKNRQHVLPRWAFDGYRPTPGVRNDPPRLLHVPPTPKPLSERTYNQLVRNPDGTFPPTALSAFGDGVAPGQVLHGIPAEWNGTLIGGNGGNANAWEAMAQRVKPDQPSQYQSGTGQLDQNLKNWGAYNNLVRCYKVVCKEMQTRLHPDANFAAMLYSYDGMVPGPTFRFRHGMPCVVRFDNQLQTEISIHHHGGHNPSHSDGFPSFYALQNQAKDYFYPNILPLRIGKRTSNGYLTELDYGEGQSTTWYHDHGLDATAYNVSHGLAGFVLWFDELELKLIRNRVLPGLGPISAIDPDISSDGSLQDAWTEHAAAHLSAKQTESQWAKEFFEAPGVEPGKFYPAIKTPYFNPYDVPIVLQDRIIDQDTGQIVYDSDGHNGYIGNVQLANGRPWPAFEVCSRQYRLRMLDGSNARVYRLRFLDSDTFGLRPNGDPEGSLEPANLNDARLEDSAMEFYRIGKDSWLYPTPQKVKSVLLNMANRADLVVDFKVWYEQAKLAGRLDADGNAVYYLVNTMPQFDGRGPKGKLAEDAGDPMVFPLPFNLNPANPIVQNMSAAGVVPAAFFGPGPQGQMVELNQPIGLIKFIIKPDEGEGPPTFLDESTILRPHHPIADEDVMAVREFVFERGKGAWMVNSRFYDPTLSNANPIIGIKGQDFKVPSGDTAATLATLPSLDYAEEWILRNGGGGWWHPIHIHLEAHQLVAYEKDFEADGLVGADGILGARGQAAMAGLPDWDELVGKFGLDWLAATIPDHATKLAEIRDKLLHPKDADFDNAFKATNPLLPVLLEIRHPGTALLPAIIRNPGVNGLLKKLPEVVQSQVQNIFQALMQLRLQWAGEMVANHDTQALGPNTIARIRMRFRTWTGPFVFHCHNVEHEDMRMMCNFEPTMSGLSTQLNEHDPNLGPAARSYGQDVTDLLTNPFAVGEMPWESIDGFPHYRWEEKPVPGIGVDEAGDPIIAPREPKK